jgi:hypothetical protein
MSTNTKLIIDCNTGTQELVAMTAEEIVAKEAHTKKTLEARAVLNAEKLTVTNLKASAKAKLIAGEALTEDEANILTGV